MKFATRTRTVLAVALMAAVLPGAAGAAGKKNKNDTSEAEKAKWNVSNPPGEWRTVTIDTRTTTWSSVDVSPDGATLLFDMLGDIYTVPLVGGEATALTDGIEWNVQPRFSPDGRRIAFISDREGGDNLWVMNADGSEPRSITSEKENLIHNPSWSPDGDWIVAKKGFVSTRSIPAGEIWMFHLGGGGGVQLTERPNGERDQKTMAEPAFSADGDDIFFSQDTTPGRVWAYNKDSTGQIFVIRRLDRETGRLETFIDGAGGAILPTPSPDGKRLAFVRRTPGFTSAIYVKNLESGLELPVYDRLDRDLQETNGSQGNTPAIAWTPDSRSLVFWSAGTFHHVDVSTGKVTDIPVHVKTEKTIAPTLRVAVDVAPETFKVKMLRWTQRSPDGRHVLFQALGHLYVKTATDEQPRRLTGQTDHYEFFPSFSPDGRQVVYTTWDDQDLGSVRVVSTDGGPARILTERPGHYVEPSFSRDGQHIVYRKIAGGFLLSGDWSEEPGLYVISSRGGSPTRVSRTGANPQFSADGERVLFSEGVEETQLALKSVNLAGNDERTHLKGAKVTEMRISPDGRWVAFTEQYNAYVAPFALSGKTVDIGKDATSVPVRQVSARAGEFLHWSPDSAALHWNHGPRLFTRELHDAFAFLEGAPEDLPEPLADGIDLSFPVPFDRPAGRIALKGARIVTMRDAENTQEVIENGVILVSGNRIEALGRELPIPSDARVIDVSGKTIVPGFIDVHAHGAMSRSELTPEQNWMQFSNLAFGVTTVHDPSNDTSSVFAAAELQKAGMMTAPRIFSTGTILYGAHAPGFTAAIDSAEEARFHVQRLKDVGAISVKSYQQPRRDQRQQVIAAGRELGIMVVPEGGAKFQHNMNEIVDGHTGIEHALSIVKGYDDVKQLWSQTTVGYTPTFVVAYGGLSGENYWYDRTEVWTNERLMRWTPRFLVEPRAIRRTTAPDDHYNHIQVARFAKELRDLGVTVHIGAHGQREGLAAHWEMWMMEQGGFTPWEALRAGTIDGARYLGLDGDLGSIEVGKLADSAVIDGNPLEDLRRSEYLTHAMINGRLYDAATMNQVAPGPVERQPFFFEKPGGDTIHPTTAAWLQQLRERFGWEH